MKLNKLLLLVSLCLFTAGVMSAQTKAKTSTAKTPAKTATKTGAKKAPKAINVYICDSPKDKYFHKYSACSKLSKCSNDIRQIKSAAELKKFKKSKSCPHCYNL